MTYTKLTVGDINAFDRYRKDERRSELISITRELYKDGDIPDGEVSRIEREIQNTQGLDQGPNPSMGEVIFLIWRSLLKSNPDISLEEVGNDLDIEQMNEVIDGILPQDDKLPTKAKKKTVRKKKQKDN